MSADSTAGDGAASNVALRGKVERQLLAPGTKSEHSGLVLCAEDGTRYRLRRRAGNPFQDPVLAPLEGRHVTLHGQVDGTLLWVESWTV